MNYHCIEVMIKAQREDEEKRCHRMRMLKQAGCPDESLRGQLAVAPSPTLSSWKNWGKSLSWFLLHKNAQRNQEVKNR